MAAADIESVKSVVKNDEELSSSSWHLSIMHLSDYHMNYPRRVFLLLEQRSYTGEHVLKKITYEQGEYQLIDDDESFHPNDLEAMREKLFAPTMEYKSTTQHRPMYYASYHTLKSESAL